MDRKLTKIKLPTIAGGRGSACGEIEKELDRS